MKPAMKNDEVAISQIPLPKDQERRNLEWKTLIKVTLIIFNHEQRAEGIRFMKRVKERCDQYYPDYRDASWQELRDNAARFKKEPEVMNSILLRRRNEMQQEETRHEEDLPEENHEARSDIDNNDTDNNGVVEEQADELTEDDKEPVRFFQIKIESMNH